MNVLQSITASALLGGTSFSIPVIAVVEHKRDVKEQPNFAEVLPVADAIRLYDKEGAIVARCDKEGEVLVKCVDREGRDVTDLMNAWYQAYMSERNLK